MLRFISRLYFWLTGWKAVGKLPAHKKYVLVAAPHTTTGDFPTTMATCSLLGIRMRYLAKKELFKAPLGWIMRAFGGIPVERSKNTNMIERMAEVFDQYEELALIVPVEGTRGFVEEWKSGFYYIALRAQVPIVLGFLDYKKKQGGVFEKVFYPSGDYEADLPLIKEYFREVTPKYPEKSSLKDYFKK